MQTDLGRAVCGDSLEVMRTLESETVDLCVTSPPYDLTVPRAYGNEKGQAYIDWLLPFCREIRRLLKPTGSFVLNIGSSWNGPEKKATQYRVLLELLDRVGFHLAQDCIWHNVKALPTGRAPTTHDRLVPSHEAVWWLSKTQYPKADTRQVVTAYRMVPNTGSQSNAPHISPSGHMHRGANRADNGGALPRSVLMFGSVNGRIESRCPEEDVEQHPARFPEALPEFFTRFLTDPADLVLDPFAGSLTTGAVAERLGRRWLCIELDPKYIQGGRFRFEDNQMPDYRKTYQLPHPGYLWTDKQGILV